MVVGTNILDSAQQYGIENRILDTAVFDINVGFHSSMRFPISPLILRYSNTPSG